MFVRVFPPIGVELHNTFRTTNEGCATARASICMCLCGHSHTECDKWVSLFVTSDIKVVINEMCPISN